MKIGHGEGVRKSDLTDPLKHTLLEVLISWLGQRLSTLGIEEIKKMFNGELPDLRDTQLGKDFINIGKEEGKIKGKQEDLIWAMESKFGSLGPDVQQRVEQCTSVEKLKDLLLQVMKVNTLEELNW